MAISVTYIGGDTGKLAGAIKSSGIFSTVSLASTAIHCRDAGGNTPLRLSAVDTGLSSEGKNIAEIYTGSAQFNISNNYEPAMTATNVYSCKSGVAILYEAGKAYIWLLITKTNNNQYAIIENSVDVDSTFGVVDARSTNVFQCYAWGDYAGLIGDSVAIRPHRSHQTMMFPFGSTPSIGTISYTPNAFMIPYGQHYANYLAPVELVFDGKSYLSNGFWAMLDE